MVPLKRFQAKLIKHDLSHRKSTGASLIEILIALLIFSTVLLAIAQMQINAIHWTKQAEMMSLADYENATKIESSITNLSR